MLKERVLSSLKHYFHLFYQLTLHQGESSQFESWGHLFPFTLPPISLSTTSCDTPEELLKGALAVTL